MQFKSAQVTMQNTNYVDTFNSLADCLSSYGKLYQGVGSLHHSGDALLYAHQYEQPSNADLYIY
jgi:hypothetical protein